MIRLEPGLHRGLPMADYLALPAMSSSDAVELMASCPERAWFGSALNPERPQDDARNAELGTAAHVALLEPESWAARVVIVDADDWRTKASQAARKEARAAGLAPILAHEAERVCAMAARVHAHPEAGPLLMGGVAEPVAVWRDAETGVLCKARTDYRGPEGVDYVDYKTAPSAHPAAFEAHAYAMGYFQQAAWHAEGEIATSGVVPVYHYIVQERTPPFIVEVMRPETAALEYGLEQNRRARDVWADCLRRGEWPAYRAAAYPDRPSVHRIGLPARAEFAREERRQSPRVAIDADIHRAWAEAQAPL